MTKSPTRAGGKAERLGALDIPHILRRALLALSVDNSEASITRDNGLTLGANTAPRSTLSTYSRNTSVRTSVS